ncbi:universal stress protein [Fulvivirga sp. RKSG066]|uniref:universal stress protein n=1 Tax=Fulvivirga aurantia TaxID=2529383 RepID=UPI0012BD3160|nr:universal stress protein [Fulvivirga aurantia]MTI21777.1 universal stress protein [Fulvivirga aurantia]
MQNLQKILIPTDFSPVADNALVYAINLAENICAQLYILHVKDESAERQFDVEEKFNHIKHHYLFNRKLNVEFIEREGNVVSCIKDTIAQTKTDLTIMGIKGFGDRDLVIGSVTAAVIDSPPCALVVVPPKSTTLNPKHIAIAADYLAMPQSSELYVINYISEAFNSRVDIFHVDQPELVAVGDDNESKIRKSYDKLFSYNLHTFSQVEGEHLVKTIADYAIGNDIDLLTVLHNTTRHKDSHQRSVSKQLAFLAKSPLLIIPVK